MSSRIITIIKHIITYIFKYNQFTNEGLEQYQNSYWRLDMYWLKKMNN
ncbi:unnamed protein product [Paramecium sonneborni]|uniref:Uncharacterized protein n=1 Tax=Paramecium sonneborni TaxID=65129 RepID=A0A8S1R0N9_9CILI|nr:unnamed protein product [Paramecium sonneborni]